MPPVPPWSRTPLETLVKDILYIALAVAFFAAMLAYVRICAALAASDADAEAGGTR
jgi:hypothetical protein